MLSNLPRASITPWLHAVRLPFLNLNDYQNNCCIHLSYDIKITVQVSEYVIHLGLRPRWISVILLDLHNSSNHNQPHSIIVVSIDLLLLAHRKVREVPTTLDDRLSAHTCNEPVRTPAYALKAQHPNIAT